MTIRFSEQETKHIVKAPFNWTVSDDCPPEIRKSIEKKLKLLSGETKKDGLSLKETRELYVDGKDGQQ